MPTDHNRLKEILRETSLKSAREPIFRLASGKMSRYYVDCKQALSDPEARKLIGGLVAKMLEPARFDAIWRTRAWRLSDCDLDFRRNFSTV